MHDVSLSSVLVLVNLSLSERQIVDKVEKQLITLTINEMKQLLVLCCWKCALIFHTDTDLK